MQTKSVQKWGLICHSADRIWENLCRQKWPDFRILGSGTWDEFHRSYINSFLILPPPSPPGYLSISMSSPHHCQLMATSIQHHHQRMRMRFHCHHQKTEIMTGLRWIADHSVPPPPSETQHPAPLMSTYCHHQWMVPMVQQHHQQSERPAPPLMHGTQGSNSTIKKPHPVLTNIHKCPPTPTNGDNGPIPLWMNDEALPSMNSNECSPPFLVSPSHPAIITLSSAIPRNSSQSLLSASQFLSTVLFIYASMISLLVNSACICHTSLKIIFTISLLHKTLWCTCCGMII